MLRSRQDGNPTEVIAYADRGNTRMRSKYYRMIRHGKKDNVAVAAVARELACFIWGLMTNNITSKEEGTKAAWIASCTSACQGCFAPLARQVLWQTAVHDVNGQLSGNRQKTAIPATILIKVHIWQHLEGAAITVRFESSAKSLCGTSVIHATRSQGSRRTISPVSYTHLRGWCF